MNDEPIVSNAQTFIVALECNANGQQVVQTVTFETHEYNTREILMKFPKVRDYVHKDSRIERLISVLRKLIY